MSQLDLDLEFPTGDGRWWTHPYLVRLQKWLSLFLFGGVLFAYYCVFKFYAHPLETLSILFELTGFVLASVELYGEARLNRVNRILERYYSYEIGPQYRSVADYLRETLRSARFFGIFIASLTCLALIACAGVALYESLSEGPWPAGFIPVFLQNAKSVLGVAWTFLILMLTLMTFVCARPAKVFIISWALNAILKLSRRMNFKNALLFIGAGLFLVSRVLALIALS